MSVGEAFSLGILVGAWLGMCAMCFILTASWWIAMKINA